MGNKGWIIVSATLAVVTAISVARGFPSGPSVSTGSNPIKYFQYVDKPCTPVPGAKNPDPACSTFWKKKQVFEVPAGQTYVITDLFATSRWPTGNGAKASFNGDDGRACVLADGVPMWCVTATGPTAQNRLTTGIPIASGAKLEIILEQDAGNAPAGENNLAAFITGYLMRN